jgi:hypothetical protein
MSKARAFKTMDFVLANSEGVEYHERFLNLKGLGTLFAAFMKLTPKRIEEAGKK